jgi:hypothetical protein
MGTCRLFTRGLDHNLMLAVMRRRPQPQRDILQGWVDAARDEALAHETTLIWGGGFRTKRNQSV